MKHLNSAWVAEDMTKQILICIGRLHCEDGPMVWAGQVVCQQLVARRSALNAANQFSVYHVSSKASPGNERSNVCADLLLVHAFEPQDAGTSPPRLPCSRDVTGLHIWGSEGRVLCIPCLRQQLVSACSVGLLLNSSVQGVTFKLFVAGPKAFLSKHLGSFTVFNNNPQFHGQFDLLPQKTTLALPGSPACSVDRQPRQASLRSKQPLRHQRW